MYDLKSYVKSVCSIIVESVQENRILSVLNIWDKSDYFSVKKNALVIFIL